MTIRRRFEADFKAKVALEALRGDKSIRELAAKHKVHPNRVGTWKRQAVDGLGAVKMMEEVCLDDEKTGRMGFQTLSDHQNQAVGCPRWRHRSNGREIWL